MGDIERLKYLSLIALDNNIIVLSDNIPANRKAGYIGYKIEQYEKRLNEMKVKY